MKVVDQLKAFIVEQDVIPKKMNIHPDALAELENEKFVYMISINSENPIKRFMGIELIPTDKVKCFDIVEQENHTEQWIVKKEVKKIKQKYMSEKNDFTKDINLLFSYIGYLERELEDKTNYLRYLKESSSSIKTDDEKA
ncbi:hypothetical protein FS935_11215 [Metabacillus litoralis]|uniref:Uncharacterized protein n=1 Tax=Metabacillus litoralis TaxID=152268 RepID=A0A5C6VYQ1_9BACI|nr:hypothetical protein [Metabacillus litoralis]TXC90485.1 hypothetical protein FS935_11215 [Metabacillus litoralis]